MSINKDHFSNWKRPSSGSTVISEDTKSVSIEDSLNVPRTTFIKQVVIEITRILATECSLTQQNLTAISRLSNLKSALSFLRNFQPQHRQLHFPYPSFLASCSHQKQLQNLESICQAKNKAILKLNQGYQQAKNIYEGDLFAKDKHIMQLKKQVEILQTQNEGLTLRLRKLGLERKVGKKMLAFGTRQSKLREPQGFLPTEQGTNKAKVWLGDDKNGQELGWEEAGGIIDGKWRAND